jgi:hypothetical protein
LPVPQGIYRENVGQSRATDRSKVGFDQFSELCAGFAFVLKQGINAREPGEFVADAGRDMRVTVKNSSRVRARKKSLSKQIKGYHFSTTVILID